MSLTLVSIKTSAVTNRVNLVFSDNSYLPFFVDDSISLGLQKGQEIDEQTYQKLLIHSSSYLLKEAAYKQLSLSPQTSLTLQRKLHQKYYRLSAKYPFFKNLDPKPIIDNLINELKQKSLLDPQDYLDYVLRRFPHKSRSYLTAYLQKQGVSPNDYSREVFASLDPKATIIKTLTKKNLKAADFTDFKTKNRIISSFLRKGFALSEVKTAIDDYLNSL